MSTLHTLLLVLPSDGMMSQSISTVPLIGEVLTQRPNSLHLLQEEDAAITNAVLMSSL